MTTQPENAGIGFPIDCHVHFYGLDRVAPSLDAAVDNFGRATGRQSGFIGALLLTQSSREKDFEALCARDHIGDWTLHRLQEEPETILARRGTLRVAVTCGRQVRVDNGIEISALGTCEEFADGAAFSPTLHGMLASGSTVMIPWGFGKWTGARGRQVREAAEQSGGRFFIGDSAARLGSWRTPRLIRDAASLGTRVIAGTDPMPLPGDHRRVGSFGVLAPQAPDESAPWRSLRRWLDAGAAPAIFGRPLGLVPFVRNQVGMNTRSQLQRFATR